MTTPKIKNIYQYLAIDMGEPKTSARFGNNFSNLIAE
jgi:hypothetical protein